MADHCVVAKLWKPCVDFLRPNSLERMEVHRKSQTSACESLEIPLIWTSTGLTEVHPLHFYLFFRQTLDNVYLFGDPGYVNVIVHLGYFSDKFIYFQQGQCRRIRYLVNSVTIVLSGFLQTVSSDLNLSQTFRKVLKCLFSSFTIKITLSMILWSIVFFRPGNQQMTSQWQGSMMARLTKRMLFPTPHCALLPRTCENLHPCDKKPWAGDIKTRFQQISWRQYPFSRLTFGFALWENLACMPGNLGRLWSFYPKSPCTHVGNIA